MAPHTAASKKWPASSRNSASAIEFESRTDFEFIDVGCGDGRSTETVRRKLGIRGKSLGIDRSGKDLPESKSSTMTFLESDLLSLPNKKQCQFTTLINVLPGMVSYAAAFELLRKACMICRDFVYVSQPNFDCNTYLLRLGFKVYYADRRANRFQGTSADYHRMIRTFMDQRLIHDFSVVESGRIYDSADDAIHPLQTPMESGPYDPVVHRYKPEDVVFPDPIYRNLQIILTRKPLQLTPISRRLRHLDEQDNIVVSSAQR